MIGIKHFNIISEDDYYIVLDEIDIDTKQCIILGT